MTHIGAGTVSLLAAFALAGGACGRAASTKPTATVAAPSATATVEAPAPTPTMAAAPSGALLFRASGNYVGEVYRVDAGGGNLVNLSATGNRSVGGTPSPDGSRVALTKDNHVVLVNPDGSDQVDLGPGTFVSWSPDGARILYGNFGETYGEWWIMNRDGSGAKLVVPRCDPCDSPQWLPDSRSLVAEMSVSSDREANAGLFVIGTDGAVLRSLPGTPGRSNELRVSPDGMQIAFTERVGSPTDTLYMMDVDGSGQRAVWHGSQPHALAWSPDSTRIAFSVEAVLQQGEPSPPPVRWQLIVLDIATGKGQVLDGGLSVSDIAWSPNGQQLAYDASREAIDPIRRIQVYTLPATGGTPVNVSNGPWFDTSPKWSADGKTITFSSDRSSKDGVYALDAATGTATLLQPLPPEGLRPDEQPSPTVVGGCVAPPASPGEASGIGCLSPDGQFASTVIDGRVVITRLADRAVVSAEGLGTQQAPPAWSPDSTRVAFIGTSENENWLYVFEPSTGEATRLVHADARANPTPSLLWSHDGATIYFTRGSYCTGGCTTGYMYRVAADGSGEEKLTDLRVATLYGFAP